MATYNLGVRLETFHNIDAKNLKDAFKKVKESWKDMHDIELNDYDITAYKDMGERLSKGKVPYRQFDEIKKEEETWSIDKKKSVSKDRYKGVDLYLPFFYCFFCLILKTHLINGGLKKWLLKQT